MNLRAGVSLLQLFTIFVNVAFGAGLFALARPIADTAKEDMWLSVICGGVLMLISLWIATRICQYFPQHTCIEYHRILLGRTLGNLLNIVLLVQISLVTVAALASFVESVKYFLFDLTPTTVLITMLLSLAVYAGQYGLAPLTRLQQILIVLQLIPFIFICLLSLSQIKISHFQPLLAEGLFPVLKGSVFSWFSYSGPELLLGLLYPFITRKHEAFKCTAISLMFNILLYTLLITVVQGLIGPKEAARELYPTIVAFRDVEIPDTFIERVEGYVMLVWISIYFTSLANLFFFTSFGIGQMLRLENSRPITALLMPLLYLLANLPSNLLSRLKITDYINISGIVWGLVILPLLLGLAWLSEKRRKAC